MLLPTLMQLKLRYQAELEEDARVREHIAVIQDIYQAIHDGHFPVEVMRVLANLSEEQWITAVVNAVKFCTNEQEIVSYMYLAALREGMEPGGTAG